MKSTDGNTHHEMDLRALKDARLHYRGCSPAFAQWLGQLNATKVIGRTDNQLLPAHVAEPLQAGEQLVLRDAVPSVAVAARADSDPLLRMPLRINDRMQGIDLLVLESSRLAEQLWQYYLPSLAVDSVHQDGQFCISSAGEIVFAAAASEHWYDVQSNLQQLVAQLPHSARQWLHDGEPLQRNNRCGQLQLPHAEHGVWQVFWCLVVLG